MASSAVISEELRLCKEHRVFVIYQVGLLMRALSFAQGGGAPPGLVRSLLDDAAYFVESLAG